MYEVIPGILEQNWGAIEKKIELVKPFAKAIHIDLLDGKFAQNTTLLDPTPFKKYSSDILFELHMMVEEPIQYLKPWADAGFKRFIGHIEKMSDQAEFVAQAQLLGEVGLALDGPTAGDAMEVPIDDLDALLIMTIKAGFSGQSFQPGHLQKVKPFREKMQSIGDNEFPIEVDGGVNDQTIVIAKEAGVNRFVTTSFLFKGENPQEQYHILQDLVA